MKGLRLKIGVVVYTVDLVGPRTTILRRDDGAYVHVNTPELEARVKWAREAG